MIGLLPRSLADGWHGCMTEMTDVEWRRNTLALH
jgi:hypothetical protein